ncbi:MAG: BaiN/RdsA family NAD(P)/FAD-dependent oxidoreductase [Candidatus Methylomirabilia bacterium]
MNTPGVDRVDVVVVGAGASGLMCAATCGARGRSVLVIDHAERIGEKIRISGGGRCNFTNRDVGAGHYQSANPHFCRSALARFTPQHLLALIEKHGIRHHEREAGQLFCDTSAREIVAMLQAQCDAAGVMMRLGCRVAGIARDAAGGFTVETSRGTFCSSSLVIATGGLSYPKLGASGFGHDVARQFGLAVVAPRPALVPFVYTKTDREIFQGLAGVSLDATIACGGKRRFGKVLFTHRGLSGPAALQASLLWTPGAFLSIDLLPDTDILGALLARRSGNAETATVLAEYLPKRLSRIWCEQRALDRPLKQLSEKTVRAIAAGLHDWPLLPGGTEGYATAEATAGGVDTGELSSKTMEAKKAPGLFFIGEVLDVTGELGGYNLHWAWASGVAAGQHA